MAESVLYGPPPATLTLLLGHSDFAPPERILGGLDRHVAARRLPGAPHSIAEIAAHLHQNMAYNLRLIQGESAHPAPAWPPVEPDEWPELATSCLETLEHLIRLAQSPELLNRTVFPATTTEPAWTVGYKLAVNVAKHNAYHFGQIVTLRQILGVWPDSAPRES